MSYTKNISTRTPILPLQANWQKFKRRSQEKASAVENTEIDHQYQDYLAERDYYNSAYSDLDLHL